MKIRPEGEQAVSVYMLTRTVRLSGPLLSSFFLLSSVGSAKTYVLQTAANWDGTGAQTVCALMWRQGAKCGSLFKLDRVEFVCTFEPFTPLPPHLHRFYQPSPSLYLPTQTWTHLSTKSCIKDTQHHHAWELPLGTPKREICEPWL